MADTITVKFKVMEDGSLQKISQGAEAAAKSTDKATKSSDNYSKKQKGVAGATSNSTKAFSKMTQGISGGLVPAYAALAANVFAISAAFNFFKRAADVKILEQGQISFGKNTGFALQTVTAGLREASGGMLGFREAAEAAAIGVAKGFSPKQLNDLADGARKASAALGRNFEDSFDRLIRGASKAEPELLDELGITLKLADATETYGNAVGKSAKDLTAFERSQAVLIETQRQLNAMYGDMEGTTNPFVELAKTFEDLVKAGTNFLMPLFEGLAKIINGSAIAAVAVFGVLGLSIAKTMIPMGDIKKGFEKFKMSSQESMAHAINDQMNYRAELQKTKAAIEGSKAQGVSGAAKALGGPSKLVQKAAAGELTDPKQIGQLKANLKKAETEYRLHGEVRKGVFKGADIAQIQSLKSALATMGKDHMTFFQRQKMNYKSMTLNAKVAFSKIKAFGTRALSAVGTAASKMGSAMNKAMKLAGFIGMFMMIIEIGQQLLQAPMDIVMGILKGLDFVVKAAMKGIGMFIDGVGNLYAGIINTLFTGINMGAEFLGLDAPLKLLSTNTTTATDAMENLAESSVNMAGSFESSSWGKGLQGFQDRRVAAAKEAEAYEKLKESLLAVGTELDSINEGLAKQKGAKKEKSGATALATLNIASSMAKALAVKDADQRENAIKLLKTQLQGIEKISPAALNALNNMDVEAMQQIEMAAQSATGSLAAMEDSIRGINSSLSSGNLIEAEFALEALKGTAEATSTAFKALFGPDSEAAKKALADFEASFSGTTMSSSQFLQSLKDLRIAQEALTLSTAKASLVGGQFKETFALQNAATQASLDIGLKKLELEKELDPVKQTQIQQELQLLNIAKQKADIALQGNVQGSGMAAASATGALAGEGAQAQLSPMLGELEKLGPEGQLISSVVNGAFAIKDAFSNAFEVMGTEGATVGDKVQAGLEVAATAMSAIGGIMKNASAAQIKEIDQQIAAEQKRDGKSAASVAKIAALEKKKEAAKKKAFENDKKMQMAQIVISTASAVMQSFKNAGGFPLGMPMAVAMGALGAAQLALVAGTSYQGASGGGGAAVPTSISAGSRGSSVDLSKTQSASGELGYLRGQSGVGGAENFKPAFSGYKHRAAGGYVVGEQGPELFMPEVPGEILPSGQGMGGATNVNFSIQAVDADGVEDLLVRQRGNIIGMMREAANSYGQDFMEGIDTSIYTPSSAGATKY